MTPYIFTDELKHIIFFGIPQPDNIMVSVALNDDAFHFRNFEKSKLKLLTENITSTEVLPRNISDYTP